MIATSWSDNPNKGADVLEWLDGDLDHERYELTFLGRSQESFRHIQVRGAVPTAEVADALRRHDVYLAPSRNDPCSNALLEALASGLPAVFRASGGHPELVGEAGVSFVEPSEVPDALERLVAELDERRDAIRITPLAEVADRYLEVLADEHARSLVACPREAARAHPRANGRLAEVVAPFRGGRAHRLVGGRGRRHVEAPHAVSDTRSAPRSGPASRAAKRSS